MARALSGQPFVEKDRTPTRWCLQLINAMRPTVSSPFLNNNVQIVDEEGKPTRALIQIMFSLSANNVPNVNVPIVDPQTGFPTVRFLRTIDT